MRFNELQNQCPLDLVQPIESEKKTTEEKAVCVVKDDGKIDACQERNDVQMPDVAASEVSPVNDCFKWCLINNEKINMWEFLPSYLCCGK